MLDTYTNHGNTKNNHGHKTHAQTIDTHKTWAHTQITDIYYLHTESSQNAWIVTHKSWTHTYRGHAHTNREHTQTHTWKHIKNKHPQHIDMHILIMDTYSSWTCTQKPCTCIYELWTNTHKPRTCMHTNHGRTQTKH